MLRGPATHEMQHQSHINQTYFVKVDSSTAFADVLTQRFWSNIHSRLRPGDEVTICGENVDAQVRILSVSPMNGTVKVRVLRSYSSDDVAAKATADLVTEYGSVHGGDAFEWRSLGENGFVIINRETKEPALRGIATEREAKERCKAMNVAALVPANSNS